MAKIPKPRFNLKSPKKKSETLIFLVYRYRGKKLLYSTGQTIHPDEWDIAEQRPFAFERRNDLRLITNDLNQYATWCTDIYIEHNYGDLSVQEFRDAFDVKTGRAVPKEEKQVPSLLEYLDEEYTDMCARGNQESTLKAYRLHLNNLRKYMEERGEFTYDDVDWNFRLRLIDWLTTIKASVGYGNKTLSIFRQVLEKARRKNYHSNTKYHGSGWLVPVKKGKGDTIVLNMTELQLLADMSLYGSLKKVRDLFLIGAGTGQRFSDYSRYQPEQFSRTMKGVPLLSIISQKTSVPAKVPLNIFPWLLPILEEYEFKSPKLSMQKLNAGLKVLCKQAGLTDKVLIVDQFIGRKPRLEKSYAEKWEYVCTHTCRRSFATNLYRMGYSLAQIMPMTGHLTESQLRTYIGIDAEENAEAIGLELIRKRTQA
ncbi:MAG: phage integrase SAM-like domain-containing protein [Bacteroidota bacterium]